MITSQSYLFVWWPPVYIKYHPYS